jgi:UDPglucose 6-dehydrogenase
MPNEKQTTYSIIGLGKLGASMPAAIASRGFHVVGVDVSRSAVERLNNGRAPVQETNLEELIAANRERLTATTSHSEAIMRSDVSFVIVPTPSDRRGAFSLQYAAWAFREIGHALARKDSHHLVVLTSTVLPGSTRYALLPVLEEASGKKCGVDFGLCYSPEFIALGSVIHDFLHPDFTLVGEFDSRSGAQLEACYHDIMPESPPCCRMSLENAELTKISVNSFVTTKITFANMIADLCTRIPGGDVDVVTGAIGLDRRIGSRYLTGAMGYGGPCFPRDNNALAFMAASLGTRAGLSETTDLMNRSMVERAVQRLSSTLDRKATIAVLGLAYKPFSHVVEESQGVALARALASTGTRVICYDPLARETAKEELRDKAVILDSIVECLAQADIVAITTPDPAFRRLKAEDFENGKISIVVDFWRILAAELRDHPRIRYIPEGRSIDDRSNGERLAALWSSHCDLAPAEARSA